MRWMPAITMLFCCTLRAAEEEDFLSQARRLATTGHRAEAIDQLRKRLTQHPTDLDCETLLGAVLSWENRYEEARIVLQRALEQKPGYPDALLALIRVELWSDRPARAEELAAEGLRTRPAETELVLLKARALQAQSRTGDASKLLFSAMKANPADPKIREQWERVSSEGRVMDVAINHSEEWFSDGRAPWREDQLSVSRATVAGTVIGRMSFANRFGLNDRQAEIDFYPRIRPGTYGYLNVGWSPAGRLFPTYRLGAELYQSLGHGWEGSAGIRRLGFTGTTQIYTMSLTRYTGDWMLTARAFLTPDSAGTSRTIGLEARRYFGDGVSFAGVRIGYGASPTETRSVEDIEILKSKSVTVRFSHRMSRRISVDCSAGMGAEDRLSGIGLRSYVLNGSAHYRF